MDTIFFLKIYYKKHILNLNKVIWMKRKNKLKKRFDLVLTRNDNLSSIEIAIFIYFVVESIYYLYIILKKSK